MWAKGVVLKNGIVNLVYLAGHSSILALKERQSI
jgi:hypothetical protein